MADENKKPKDDGLLEGLVDIVGHEVKETFVPKFLNGFQDFINGTIDATADSIRTGTKQYIGGFFKNVPQVPQQNPNGEINYRQISNGNSATYQQKQKQIVDGRRYLQQQFMAQLGPCQYGKTYAYVGTLEAYNNVMSTLANKLDQYHMIKVSDLYEACKTPSDELSWASDYDNGWFTLEDIKYVRIMQQYVFNMKITYSLK